jgi:carboxyl-terminal processing protease
MNPRAALRGGAVLLILVVGFVAGIYTDQAYPDWVPYVGNRSVGRVDLAEVQEAARLIQANYVDSKFNATKVSQGTVQGLVKGLDDPFSTYYDPAAYKRLQQNYQGHYSGVGIYLTFTSGGYPTINGTVPGSPAATAGLKPGDQIIKVGDKDISGITADQATALIQGPAGSQVTLTVQRGSQTLTVTMTRADIEIPTVRSTVLGNRILYLRIYQFGSKTSADFSSALKTGVSGANGVILDLRGDPGGFVSAADDVISQFVASGETFETRGRGSVNKHQVGSTHLAPTVPLVVLVDANTASAAEIVAGSLQVHHRAKLVGVKTFGKGSVQQDFQLKDGSDLHLTVERWYLPNGQTIDHKGLEPDLTVTLASPGDAFDVQQSSLGYAKDTQLNAGLALLTGG